MRRPLALALGLVLLVAAPASARSDPTGTFTLSAGPYVEGGTLTYTQTSLTGVNKNYEVTIGTWCFRPDGTQLLMGNHGNPYIYEVTQRGGFTGPQFVPLPVEGTGYSCTAQMIAALWRNGVPLQAWTLDAHTFTVDP